MANVIACYKWVVDEADIRFKPDGSADTGRASYKISDYDKNAIQAAVDLAGDGDEVVVLTFGAEGAKKSLKEALSRGADRAYFVADAAADAADGVVTAEALAAAIKAIGDVKAVVCSDGAGDTYGRQTGPRIAALLGMPSVSSVIALEVEGDKIVAQRKLEAGVQTIEAVEPCVISVLPEINTPPIPSMKAVLGASKKPTEQVSCGDIGLDGEALEARGSAGKRAEYVSNRKNVMIPEGSAAEMAAALVDALRKDGVL